MRWFVSGTQVCEISVRKSLVYVRTGSIGDLLEQKILPWQRTPRRAAATAKKLADEKLAAGWREVTDEELEKLEAEIPPPPPTPTRRRSGPEPFGYKSGWIAAKATPAAVAKALIKGRSSDATWKAGVEASYQNRVFVTPATTDGWVLATSNRYMQELSGIDDIRWLLASLGNVPEVQLFATFRVIGLVAWGLARKGKLVRAVFTVDGTLATFGKKVAGEPDDLDDLDEGSVMELARAWSVDPTQIENYEFRAKRGLVGDGH